MTLLEYVKSMDKEGRVIYSDGYSEGVYIDIGQLCQSRYEDQIRSIISPILTDPIDCPLYSAPDDIDDIRYIDEQRSGFLTETNIMIDEEVAGYDSYARRPYFRARGPRVTERQAFEIIRRTDRLFQLEIGIPGAIDILHFPNWWFSRNHHPTHYGWCHPSGIIGLNGITDRYPNIVELIDDMIKIKYAFPYLDLVIGITGRDEVHPDKWDRKKAIKNEEKRREASEQLGYRDYPDFMESIEIGIWLHGDTIEFMSPSRAKQVYKEYIERYEEKNKDIYMPGYYQDHKIFTANNEYLKRCIEAAGLDPEEILSTLREHIWKDSE